MDRWRFITIIILLNGVSISATDIYLPSFPAIRDSLSTSSNLVQFTITSYLLSFSFSQMICGPYSDIVGRYKIIKYGLIATLFSTVICIISVNITMLIIGRFMQGIGLGAVTVSGRAMIADLYKGREMAKIGSAVGALVPVIIAMAPLIGGIIQEYIGWREVFIFFLMFSILILLVVLSFLEETNKQLQKKSMSNILDNYVELFSNKIFMLYLLIPGMTVGGIISYITLSPYIFQEILHLSPKENGLVTTAIAGAAILGAAINSRLLNKFRSEQLLLISTFLMILSSICLFYLHFNNALTITNFVIGSMVYFLSINFAFSNGHALSYKYATKNLGTASALITGSQNIIGMFASLIISILPSDNIVPIASMFLLSGVLILFTTLLTNKYSFNEVD